MLTDIHQSRLFELYIDQSKSFFGIFDKKTLRPLRINPAGLAMFKLDSVADYPVYYPFGFRKEPITLADFHASFDAVLAQGPWEGRAECRQHTGQALWVWLQMMAIDVDGQGFLLMRATDTLFLRELGQQVLPSNAEELARMAQQRTSTLLDTLRELEAAKQAMEESLAQERTLSTRKTEFITAVSHEFRTPLAILQTSAALLPLLSHAPGKQRQHAEVIQAQIAHLTALLDALVQQTLHGEAPPTAANVHQIANSLKPTK